MYRQPYSMHLQLTNCMFGRQIEAQLIIDFLLHAKPHGGEDLEVLPIVGQSQVGKSTLVAHICEDERVHGYFSEILFFRIHGSTNDEVATFRKGCEIKHQNHMSNFNLDRRLVVIESIGDLNEDAWNRMYSAIKQFAPSGSKIIVTSQSDNIVKFGTTQALTLKHLSCEAYWYFFKTLTFGSMDPEMHPRFTHLAMEIAKTMNSSLTGANTTARLLRENFDIHFWCKVLNYLRRSFQKHVSRFGEHPMDLLYQNRPTHHIARMVTPSEDFVVHHQRQCSSEEEVPQITLEDVVFGSVKPHGKFEVLVWMSRIPPYYSYVYTFLGELTTRSINFFISKISKPTPLVMEDRLSRVLLRAQVIIDEATGRRISSQAMVQQLHFLRDAMHRGYYMLDTFRDAQKKLKEVFDELSSMILAVKELVVFLTSYP
ncbi:hypothetical protein BAE44_0002439 [Dichanthelium oligosanthes]|uniref:NB-ARC domain-containing protein n=1 Tax=Dichanthelium oligosanthes TaxID=888268 RepID=A0A1E5WGM1_9POAL|nr:hypothetical protein BAE44_0002439 [Dichanthelium oligosanthes]